MTQTLASPHAQPLEKVLESLEVNPQTGLSSRERARRRSEYGDNALGQASRRKIWSIMIDQAKSVVLLLMGAAALLAFTFGEWAEGIAISAVLVARARPRTDTWGRA